MTPEEWLHATALVAGTTEDTSSEDLDLMVTEAQQHLRSIQPINVTISSVVYHPEAIMLGFTPDGALDPIHRAVRQATLTVTGQTGSVTGAAAILAVEPGVTDDEVGARLAARLERQAILTRDDPPTAWFLVDEAALRRRIGLPEVMAAQLGELMGYAAPLARRQRRALPWEARPPRAGPHAPGQRRSARLVAARLDAVLAQGRPQSF